MAPTLTLHFARHAETLFNTRRLLQGWCDSPLTAQGRAQASALGRRLQNAPLTAIYTSDLTRARETAALVLAEHLDQPPVTTLKELRERHFGSFEGQPNATLWGPVYASLGYQYGAPGAWSRVQALGHVRVLNAIASADDTGAAENSRQVHNRTSAAINMILHDTSRPAGAHVLVVTHGAVLRSLISHLIPGWRQPCPCPNGGTVTIQMGAEGPFVREYDITAPVLP